MDANIIAGLIALAILALVAAVGCFCEGRHQSRDPHAGTPGLIDSRDTPRAQSITALMGEREMGGAA